MASQEGATPPAPLSSCGQPQANTRLPPLRGSIAAPQRPAAPLSEGDVGKADRG